MTSAAQNALVEVFRTLEKLGGRALSNSAVFDRLRPPWNGSRYGSAVTV